MYIKTVRRIRSKSEAFLTRRGTFVCWKKGGARRGRRLKVEGGKSNFHRVMLIFSQINFRLGPKYYKVLHFFYFLPSFSHFSSLPQRIFFLFSLLHNFFFSLFLLTPYLPLHILTSVLFFFFSSTNVILNPFWDLWSVYMSKDFIGFL